MAVITPPDFARKLVRGGRHLDASHVLETHLLMRENDPEARLLLAQVYIVLKEGHYRSLARTHLERLISPDTPRHVLETAAKLLVGNVYLAAGPIEKAAPLLERHAELFSEDDRRYFTAKAAELTRYLTLQSGGRRRSSPPAYPADVANNDAALKAYIFNEFQAQSAERDLSGPYFTFGSCFAGNVARAMKAAGAAIDSFWVGEEVNTTFSNVNLLRFIVGEPVEHEDYYRNLMAAQDVARLRQSLQRAENIIYTLGVALAFFEDGSRYVPHNPANLRALLRSPSTTYRFSTVEENDEQLALMRDLLARHTRVRNVFLTVSPVPLAASLRSASAAVDDSESKSILRTAAGVACRSWPETFTYFPSFEAFRWLPCFQDRAAFGGDDGSLRHANGDLVDQVVAVFMDAAKIGRPAAAE